MRSVLLATVAAVVLPFAHLPASAQSPADQASQPSADSLLDQSTPSGETRSGATPAAAADARSAEAAPPASAAAPTPAADEQPRRSEPTRSAETAPPEPAASPEPDAKRAVARDARGGDRDETGVADSNNARDARPDRRPDVRAAARTEDRTERRAEKPDRQRSQASVTRLRTDDRSTRTTERSARINRAERTSLRAERRSPRRPEMEASGGPARFYGDEGRTSSRGYRVVERPSLSDDAQFDRARRAAHRHAMTVAGYEDDAEMYSEGRRVLLVRPYRRIIVVED